MNKEIYFITHAASVFLVIGFSIFLWMISKKTKKLIKKSIKATRRRKAANL
jgi:hypothetical protein